MLWNVLQGATDLVSRSNRTFLTVPSATYPLHCPGAAANYADTLIWSGLYQFTRKNTASVCESKEQVAPSPYKKSILPLNAPVRSLTNISSKKCAGRPCSYVAYVCLSVSLICCLCTHSSRNAATIYEEIMNWKRKNI